MRGGTVDDNLWIEKKIERFIFPFLSGNEITGNAEFPKFGK